MKKLLFVILFAAAGVLLMSAVEKPMGMAQFKWVETTHDFEKIPQGTPASTEFKFKNVGDVPLVITNVQGSCGCTVTDYTKEPVAPGKEGMVKATYNAARVGAFNKTVRVTANIEGGTETLTIKGEVVSQAEAKK
ncbi:MAG: DUF1573 domain-containing protein [Candidatus Cyclobacteriaceae bacterium M3_2C_046]